MITVAMIVIMKITSFQPVWETFNESLNWTFEETQHSVIKSLALLLQARGHQDKTQTQAHGHQDKAHFVLSGVHLYQSKHKWCSLVPVQTVQTRPSANTHSDESSLWRTLKIRFETQTQYNFDLDIHKHIKMWN